MSDNPAVKEFIQWEVASRDTIDFKKIYVYMTGDLNAGLMLSQIMYWHLPDKKGDSKLRVKKAGKMWLAKTADDWWGECCLTPRQVPRALEILTGAGIVETKLYKFDGAPTTHIHFLWDRFLELWNNTLVEFDNCVIWKSYKKTKPNYAKGKKQSRKKGNSLTETTAETNTENTAETTISADKPALKRVTKRKLKKQLWGTPYGTKFWMEDYEIVMEALEEETNSDRNADYFGVERATDYVCFVTGMAITEDGERPDVVKTIEQLVAVVEVYRSTGWEAGQSPSPYALVKHWQKMAKNTPQAKADRQRRKYKKEYADYLAD